MGVISFPSLHLCFCPEDVPFRATTPLFSFPPPPFERWVPHHLLSDSPSRLVITLPPLPKLYVDPHFVCCPPLSKTFQYAVFPGDSSHTLILSLHPFFVLPRAPYSCHPFGFYSSSIGSKVLLASFHGALRCLLSTPLPSYAAFTICPPWCPLFRLLVFSLLPPRAPPPPLCVSLVSAADPRPFGFTPPLVLGPIFPPSELFITLDIKRCHSLAYVLGVISSYSVRGFLALTVFLSTTLSTFASPFNMQTPLEAGTYTL